jgi:hypothetical protein
MPGAGLLGAAQHPTLSPLPSHTLATVSCALPIVETCPPWSNPFPLRLPPTAARLACSPPPPPGGMPGAGMLTWWSTACWPPAWSWNPCQRSTGTGEGLRAPGGGGEGMGAQGKGGGGGGHWRRPIPPTSRFPLPLLTAVLPPPPQAGCAGAGRRCPPADAACLTPHAGAGRRCVAAQTTSTCATATPRWRAAPAWSCTRSSSSTPRPCWRTRG